MLLHTTPWSCFPSPASPSHSVCLLSLFLHYGSRGWGGEWVILPYSSVTVLNRGNKNGSLRLVYLVHSRTARTMEREPVLER